MVRCKEERLGKRDGGGDWECGISDDNTILKDISPTSTPFANSTG